MDIMTKEWYKKKGFWKNPLNIEPRFNDPLLGHDLLIDEIFYRIDASNLMFLEGKIGKTAVLLKIIEKYKGKGKVAYINCDNIKDEPDIKVVLANGKKHLAQNIRGFPKKMIILLDNVSKLSESSAEKIKYYFDQGNILSIIMTGEDYRRTVMPESLKHRIGNRIYKLRTLSKDEITDIVQERLKFPEYLKEEQVYKIAGKASDIKELFIECDAALFLMINEGAEEVDDNIIHKLFHERKKDGMVP